MLNNVTSSIATMDIQLGLQSPAHLYALAPFAATTFEVIKLPACL